MGYFINPKVPYVRAPPDVLLSCECYVIHVIELKCLYYKNNEMTDVEGRRFYLKKNQHGSLKLDRNHSYFYQIQIQLGVCKLEYAYFVIWTTNDMHFEKIAFNEQFWDNMCVKANRLIIYLIFFLRLLGVGCSSSSAPPKKNVNVVDTVKGQADSGVSVDNENEVEQRWCYCDKLESCRMFGCDNAECHTEWFHYTCLGISSAPKGKWYCPECRKLPQFKKGGQYPLTCTLNIDAEASAWSIDAF